ESLEQKITLLKNDFQKEESRNIDRELALEKEALGFQNPCYLKKAQQLKPNLYDGSVIGKSDAIVVPESEDTLMHAEESRSKIIEKQNDPQMIEKKVITKPIDYAILNQLSTDFNTRMVNSCLKKLKFHLASFDMVVKERTTATAITEGTWGFEHTKACFRDDIIPFVKNLKELFTSFDQCLIDEVTKVHNVFKQMELAVEPHCAEKTKFQTKMENVLQENDRLLTQALSVEIVNIVVYDNVKFDCLNVDACACLQSVRIFITWTYGPVNDTSSTVNHSAYMASAPQIKYAPVAYNPSEFSSPETGLMVLVFQKGDDPIDAINHMMSFLTSVVASRMTIQPIQGRQNHMLTGSSRPFVLGSGGTSKKQRVIVCYNCKGEGHMSKQCTKPKRKRDAEWFKNKVLLVQAQANGQVLQEEELDFLADPRTTES
nr:hypothetical protein [Tanacetum cinerariifolium]